ncbi:gfo/Idh/MocA family oxidoreductase [Altererythrobacter salegens]|uniref:Gfo/Idh/MocA family oxidoreductase n=1 Tax=Croceibacterium salegens TaxID=1737568 RepID=A0A6I4SRZ8_9SPHN|nr:Gfo/Idh/MocA family oxidoreductase [Croceibacterium salegens]MXO58653.1 gfo/Idh/MocA family oxidoreductase [Croceibacterium salegens]
MSESKISRRQFVAAAGAIPIAASASRALGQEAKGTPLAGDFALPDPPGNRMRWAIVGLGNFTVGEVIPGIRDSQHSRMTAFVSGSPDKQKDLGARYGVSRFYNYENFDRIADDPEIDCVYIVLPVGLHAEYTIRALKAGKHVLCEKPMASTSAECEAMIAAAKAANRQLGVAYRIHFEPTNVRAKQLIDGGEIGDLRFISCDHGFNADLNWPPHVWRLEKALAGGGSMYDIGIYGLNTSLMMIGDDTPADVTATYSYPRDDVRFREVEGGIDFRLRTRKGLTISGSSSYCWSPYISSQRYMGSKASIFMKPATTYDLNTIVLEGNGPQRTVGAGDPWGQFAAQIDAFSHAARANTPHRTPGEMGLRDIRIIEAMYRSADNGGAIVAL